MELRKDNHIQGPCKWKTGSEETAFIHGHELRSVFLDRISYTVLGENLLLSFLQEVNKRLARHTQRESVLPAQVVQV
jgi:hypothetical protein